MSMMTRTQLTDARRNIQKQIVPWISIVVIGMVSLVAYLSLAYSTEAIQRTVSAYYDRYRFWDLEISSTLLMDDDDLRAIRLIPGVELAEPVRQVNTQIRAEGAKESVSVQSLSKEISVPELLTGRLPSVIGECAVEQHLQETLALEVGDRIEVESVPVAGVEALSVTQFRITGVFRHPDHISFEVPETPYVLVTEGCFNLDGLDGAFMKTRIRVADEPTDRYGDAYREAVLPVQVSLAAMEVERTAAREAKLRAGYEQKLRDGQEELDSGAVKLRDAEEQLADARKQLDDGWTQLAGAEKELVAAKAKLDAGAQALGQAEYQLAAIPPWFAAISDQIDPSGALGAQYKNGLRQYGEGRMAWYAAGEEYLDGLTLYDNNRKKLEQGEEEYAQGMADYTSGKADYDAGVSRLQNARAQLDQLGSCRWLVVNDRGNAGYIFAENQANGLFSLSYSFSVIFLVIAVLVIYATVGRMIQEQRALVGASKALGLYNREILAKYLFFGMTAGAAAVLLGIGASYWPMQKQLLANYEVFFTFASIQPCFLPLETGIVALSLPLIAAASVWFACSGLVRIPAIRLLQGEDLTGTRKKARQSSRGGLYTRLIIRNIRTDLKRVLVTTVSISGCCMLLMVGFTIKYAIERVNDRQFGKVIQFQAELYFDPEEANTARRLSQILDENDLPYVLVRKSGFVFKNGDSLCSATAIVSEPGGLDGFYGLKDARSGEDLRPTDDGILIPSRLSTYRGLNPGDSLPAYDSSLELRAIPIAGVFTNHFGNLLFFSNAGYEKAFETEAVRNCFLVRLGDMALSVLEAKVENVPGLIEVRDAAAERVRFDSFSSILNLVILMLLGLAGVMAYFIVMNLSVTYIHRKTKELTIMRINGFTVRECVIYVSWDLVITTLFGILLGLAGGHFLGQAILPVTEGPYMQFVHEPDPRSYLFSALITAGFSALISSAALRRVKYLKLSDVI